MTPLHFTSTHITGDRFADCADIAINSPAPCRNEDKIGSVGRNIIFCKTDFVPQLFDALYRIGGEPRFVLITHNSDYVIGERMYDLKPANVKHWFAENVVTERPGLTCIPLGLERPGGGGISGDPVVIANLLYTEPERDGLVYVNFAVCNNASERGPCMDHFMDRPWATHERNVSFADYCASVRRHRFVACPEGNGPDTHRLWEALYLGAIPIVKRSAWSLHIMRMGLPIMFVDDWEEVTEGALVLRDEVVRSGWWSLQKATVGYWWGKFREALL